MNKPLKLAFIGSTGHWGYALHSLTKHKADIKVVGAAAGSTGEDISRLAAAVTNAGFDCPIFTDPMALLSETKPDIAIIAPHFCDHAALAIAALEHGAHVYMDKPISTTWQGLSALESAHAASGKYLTAMFGLRFEPHFLCVKQIIDDGLIGQVRMLHGQKSYKMGNRGEHYRQRKLYGGTIPWVASHAVDWARWLSGREFVSVAAAHSTIENRGHKDMEATAACLFTMEGGVLATVTADYLRPACAPRHDDDRVRVTGTQGMVEVIHQQVFLETNDAARHLVTLPASGCPFTDFLNGALGLLPPCVTARDSFAITRACLMARDAADTGMVLGFN